MSGSAPETKPRHRMSTGNRILFFTTAWLIVLMPFLFWWNTWFGRELSDKQLTTYLHDTSKPRHIQHALVQIGERINKHDPVVTRWYPDLVRLASFPVDEVRNTDAWVMGQDTAGPGFHEALLKMLSDSSITVRGNAALSLVRFGDATGRPQIVALLQPADVAAPKTGKVVDVTAVGTSVRQGGLLAKLQLDRESAEVRSPIAGRVRSLAVQSEQQVPAGATVATVSPSMEQAWEALRGLYVVGRAEDLPAVTPYERDVPEISAQVRQQAMETDKAIRARL
jgi:biotin carboxyl carrier protein